MHVEVEVLNGKRKGHLFSLPAEQHFRHAQDAQLPFILETEAVAFRLRTYQRTITPKLFFHGTGREFTHQTLNEDGSITHELFPKWENGYYETFFYNYFGTVFIDLEITEAESVQLFHFLPFEVLAKKMSAIQAEKMITFIITETHGNLQDIPGASFFPSPELDQGSQPHTLIAQMQKNVAVLETVTSHIVHQPITVLSSNLQLREGNLVSEVTAQGIDWLTENSYVLQKTNNHLAAHVFDNGSYYRAQELQVPVIQEQTDIYENRFIHGFILQLLKLTARLIEKYEEVLLKRKINSYNSYVSFFDSMKKALLHLNEQYLEQARICRQKLLHLKSIYERYLPVSHPEIGRLRITPKIRCHTYYLTLFQSMADWFKYTEINWRSLGLWLAIDNIPRLFEYYTALRVVNWCRRALKDFRLTGENRWEGTAGNYHVTLHYEPVYWMTGHIRAGTTVNTENRDIHNSEPDTSEKHLSGEYQNRSPDIVISIKNSTRKNEVSTFIIDAKYTTREKAFSMYLPQCTMKYVHGISDMSIRMNTLAMIILYPDDKEKFLDFHVSPFNVYGSKPQLPVLGIQAISVDEKTGKDEGLEQLLLRLFELSEGANTFH